MIEQLDNSTIAQKVALRRSMLDLIDNPVVMETHGGFGRIWESCYMGLEEGVVLEKRRDRVSVLAHQRPTWAVYEGDSASLLAAGVGAHLPINVLDVDPYGSCWPVIEAFFNSDRPYPDTLALVAHCGLRLRLMTGMAWDTSGMESAVIKFGNDLYSNYLEVCEWKLGEAVNRLYVVDAFSGYYCGASNKMTHFAAILKKAKSPE